MAHTDITKHFAISCNDRWSTDALTPKLLLKLIEYLVGEVAMAKNINTYYNRAARNARLKVFR